ncbi:NADH-quinone oxidoreductase subunit H [candidate division KSB1 bacterium]|nr:NADH-quinone oxidoreductase subunit H [candidate division KSB1 bacterium]
MVEGIGIVLAKLAFVLLFVLNFGGLLTWVERKQSALMQDRIGANRASIFGIRIIGLFHTIADAVKMFTKESFRPVAAEKFLFTIAPAISVFFALVGFAVIPFGDVLIIGGKEINLQLAPLNIGVLYLFAVAGMAVYGVVLGAWASKNNFALLGGLRASAQMISYEVVLGVTIIGSLMIYQSVELQEIVRWQGGTFWGWLPKWGILLQPVGFILFLTVGIAVTKRVPFDAPEGESEIIGYFLEYSGMGFGMYMLTDFVETVMVSAITVTLFLGGWQVPYLMADGFHFPWGATWQLGNLAVALLQVGSFTLKVMFFLWLQMTIRWTLPRFRYDQIMRLGWKYILPIALVNILITGLVIVLMK